MIRAKLVIRNVISKPLRSLIIILSLAAAAFASLFCISGINSAKNSLKDYFGARYGDVDIMVFGSMDDLNIKESELPTGAHLFSQSMANVYITVPNGQYFNYVDKYSITIIGSDTKLGNDLRMYDSAYPTKNGVTVTTVLAAQLDKKVGDAISFFGNEGVKYDLKILDIVDPPRSSDNSPVAIFTTQELCNKIGGYDEGTSTMMYADVPSDQIASSIKKLTADHPKLTIVGTTTNDDDEAIAFMLNIYYLIFAVVFLMVCFIVVSMSKHIVNERMSVIGMLRSIGGSILGTGLLLLCESAFYGLCGGILGTLLFLPMRNSSDIGIFAVVGEDYTKSDGINILTILLVIFAVILLECAFSASAVLRAAKTPVRDIIFGTKETAYIPSKLLAVVGAILLVVGIAVFVMFYDFTMLIAAAFCSAIGAVLLFPMLLNFISKGLAVVFGKLDMPVAKLAAKEAASTKSSVSSSQLILSAISLTIAVFIIGVSMISFFTDPVYKTEVLITYPTQSISFYDHVLKGLDGVEDVECLRYLNLSYEDRPEINDEERDMRIMALNEGGFRYLTGIQNVPSSLAENEAAIDSAFASKLSLGVGDEITVKVNRDKYLPTTLKLKIKDLINSSTVNNYCTTVLINDDLYRSVFYDNVSIVLVKTAPGMEYSVADIMKSTLPDNDSDIQTIEEYKAVQEENSSGLLTIIYAVIILGFALSLMGTSSNMLMGFEQSRRKYAVYYSSSMSKGKLRRLIVIETALVSGISVAASVIFGLYFLNIIRSALSLMALSVELVSPFGVAVMFGAGAFALLMTVAIKPVMMLSKMNIAEEIKTGTD